MDGEIVVRGLLFVVMVGSGILMLWLAGAAASGRLKRNPYAGIRVPVTMASDQAWLAAHQAAKRPTHIAGWCAVASGIPSILPVSMSVAMVAVFIGSMALLGFVLYGAKQGSRAARNLPPESAPG
ncbi:SdpI family protein [Arthrobacter sp. 260]|uniref:SdpI family protein n=1 Tax=Arthrobacter sp. 260 TaxID=2735314 RepID=UPI00149251F4|nr:SdpI family protein [Arthrobacter sp. 260]NOJ58884.1 SdpI family protein [Arthrobacter sp. 260]